MRVELLLLGVLLCFPAGSQEVHAQKSTPQESEIDLCQRDSDCVIVPYRHCCGATKRAINKKYLKIYQATPEWQVFEGPACAMMGVCPPDDKVISASCKGDRIKQCQLNFVE